MLTIAYYLLKVMICSGILYGYYLLALRNKAFHRWNRFYLLATMALSISIPLIKINISQKNIQPVPQVFRLLNAINSRNEFTGTQVVSLTLNKNNVDNAPFIINDSSEVNYPLLIMLVYSLIALVLLFGSKIIRVQSEFAFIKSLL